MLELEKIRGLEGGDDWLNWSYKMRDKAADMEANREYHKHNPPKVGDIVVVLHTASHNTMMKPHITKIVAITDRGRIVVDHDHEAWAGKSFWKSGQNCKAPTGQCWLVPAELYRDIPISRDTERQRRAKEFSQKTTDEQLSVSEMSKMLGGAREFVAEINILISDFKLTKAEAMKQLSRELRDERLLTGKRNQFGKRIDRQMIRNHSRYHLKENYDRMCHQLQREDQMIEKGRMRSEGRRKQWQKG